jgi:2-methylisocitrate lyase-like PEP mutase family enzyme
VQSQCQKAAAFRALHQREGAFIISNPWDIGTAPLLAYLGFEALATTSAGYAFSVGKPDYSIDRDEMLQHAGDIVSASDLPVNADLENGFADEPAAAAETYRLAAATGLVGASIEDATGRKEDPIYEPRLATERVRAAVEAIQKETVSSVET